MCCEAKKNPGKQYNPGTLNNNCLMDPTETTILKWMFRVPGQDHLFGVHVQFLVNILGCPPSQ